MTCADVRRWAPGYLDDALPERLGPDAHARIRRHLEKCAACRAEIERYVQLSAMMSNSSPIVASMNLSTEIRMAVAQARAETLRGRLNRWKDRLQLLIENILEPLAVPATGGLFAALVVFAIVSHQFIGVGIPLGVANDLPLPTNLLQPARLETLAGLRMSGLIPSATAAEEPGVLVEATVSAAGQAVSYRVLSGSVDRNTQRELDQVVLLSRFRPQLSFGRPLSGGRVLLRFNTISVRG